MDVSKEIGRGLKWWWGIETPLGREVEIKSTSPMTRFTLFDLFGNINYWNVSLLVIVLYMIFLDSKRSRSLSTYDLMWCFVCEF